MLHTVFAQSGTNDLDIPTHEVLEDSLAVRVQLQLHKYIWDPGTRGV